MNRLQHQWGMKVLHTDPLDIPEMEFIETSIEDDDLLLEAVTTNLFMKLEDENHG